MVTMSRKSGVCELEIGAVPPMRDLSAWRRRMWTPRPQPPARPVPRREARIFGFSPAPLPGDLWPGELRLREYVAQANAEIVVALRRPSFGAILRVVAAYYRVDVDDMRSERRTRDVAFARHVAMFLAHDLLGMSYPKIGRHMGGRDHTTALHGVRKIGGRMAASARFRAEVEGLAEKVRLQGIGGVEG